MATGRLSLDRIYGVKMNRSDYDSFLYQLVIEDHPNSEFDDIPPVDPRGEITDKEKLLELASEIHRFGVQRKMWSAKATLYIANVVIGAGELGDTNLPVQAYFTGLASLMYKINDRPTSTCIILDTFNPPVETLRDMAELIRGSFSFVAQPYAIPIVVYEDQDLSKSYQQLEAKHSHTFSTIELEQMQRYGQTYFGYGATTLLLPVHTSKS